MPTGMRKSTRKRTSSTDEDGLPPFAASTSSTAATSRRSSRSNRFASSFKEPTELQGIYTKIDKPIVRSKKRSKRSKPNNSSSRTSSRSSSSTTASKKQTKQTTQFATPKSQKSKSSSSASTKSPAVRHSRARRQMKVQKDSDSSDDDESEVNEDEYSDSDEDNDNDDEDDDDDDDDASATSSTPSTSSSEEEGENDDETEIKIQRIIAVRSEPKWKWKEICKRTNTSEVECGSRWFQEDESEDEDEVDDKDANGDTTTSTTTSSSTSTPIKGQETKKKDDTFEERFLVKWADLSFLHCSWETKDDLTEQVEGAEKYLTTFFKKSIKGYLYDTDDRLDGDYFDPAFCQIHRILEINLPESMQGRKRQVMNSEKEQDWGIVFDKKHEDYESELGRQFLITWGNCNYSDASYEFERDLILMDVEYQSQVDDFLMRNKKPTKFAMKKNFSKEEEERRRLYKIFGDSIPDSEEKEAEIEVFKKKLENLTFQNGGKLRDYQAEGVSWLLANHVNKRSGILADEMGLGKTIQTAAYIHMVYKTLHCRGPFLIVAPLSTIPHWQREFEGWTDLNTIVYHGTARDREIIRENEFAFESDRPIDGVGMNQKFLKKCHHRKASRAEKTWMVQVVITTPEMLVTDDFGELKEVEWEILVVDEAHRLKNHASKLALNLRSEGFHKKHTLLLTGTPIQNNMNELWTLMNFISPSEFDDCDDFMESYGNMKSKESVDGLHSVIRPYILRRLKEDVEKSVPPKEETLIEVELTILQKQYYRALYEKNVQFLHKGTKKALDGPSINNLAMQLRKCCNHPFLLKGVELKAKKGIEHKTMDEEADFLAKSSGKLVLLDKLLPKLKEGGHRLLIFSQFKIMLDILEDYLVLRKFKFERIDGSITGKKRQMAIDRYQSKASMDSSFIMLLSTRAGGVGINLTAADTCIIFDSDWNPQNDLQAQARCHRIGQTKSVKVYRLLTRKTYEMQMFHMSSLKMGLDQAVLQGIENGTGSEQSLSKEEVEKLLRCGAYDIFNEEQAGASEKESNDFIEQDIDSILARRSKTVIHENTGSNSSAAGGKFSKASFTSKGVASTPGKDVDIDDPDFWTKMVGEAKVTVEENYLESGKKRIRKKANYNEELINAELDDVDSDGYSSSSSYDDDSDNSTSKQQTCEFNFSSESTRRCELLRELLDLRRKERLTKERKRWGGKLPTNWTRPDAELVLKFLHKFGYNNVPWNLFFESYRKEASKNYDDQEIKRMCWALVLKTLQDTVDTDMADVARRTERAEQKKIEKGGNNIEEALVLTTGDSKDENHGNDVHSKEWKEKQLIISFQKVWAANKWAVDALSDLIAFSEANPPRDISTLSEKSMDVESEPTPLLDAFVKNIWPALKNRGWQESFAADDDRISWVSPKQIAFRYVDEILDTLPLIYPELSETVKSVITSVHEKMTSSVGSNPKICEIADNPSDIGAKSLTTIIKQYGPVQLLSYTERHKSTLLPRRTLETLSCLRNAHFLVNHVNALPDSSSLTAVEKYRRLSKIMIVSTRASLPHPSWKPIHDAILVSAIAKHGWIDKDLNCRAITDDSSIVWGKPFDEGDISLPSTANTDNLSSPDNSKPVDKEELKKVATRALDFLNDQTDTKDLKGFNLSLVLKSYGVVPCRFTDVDEQVEKNWRLDPTIVEAKTSENSTDVNSDNESYAELPTSKNLLKRAKIILSKSHQTTISAKPESNETHEFVVLDQGNILNIFLAELLREVVKQSQKNSSLARKTLSLALGETQHRLKSISDTLERADFTRLVGHIAMAERNCKKKQINRPVKNVLRAILGLNLQHPTNPGDNMFVVDNYDAASRKEDGKTKALTKKTNESATGDLAINKAISIAKQRSKHGFNDDVGVMLGITTIETLILSVVCSQGIPIYSEDWEDALSSEDDEMCDNGYLISWFHMGNVLEVAAEKWVEISQMHLDRVKQGGYDTAHLEEELEARYSAHKEAMRLHQKPIFLAKKSILLIEAIRLHMGPESKYKGKNGIKPEQGLGSRVFLWNKNHLTKWAKALAIYANGQTMHATVLSIRPNAIAAGFLDKRNCKAVFTQISQQTRLRSLFSKYRESELPPMVSKAVKNVKKSGDIWEGQPSWWETNTESESTDDFELLSGVLRFGYGGFDQMLRDNKRFSECTKKNKSSVRLYRSSGQQRVNCITRELGGIDDSAETIRLMNERKNKFQQPNDQRHSFGNSIQAGIHAFFTPSAPKEKVNNDISMNDGNVSDDSEIAIVAVVSPKRKVDTVPLETDDSSKRRKN